MSLLPWLPSDSLDFPSPEQALKEPSGLLCAGGDLSPERLERAYREGIFPWYEEGSPILWWSPDPRTVLRPDTLHISRSLRRRLNRRDYRVSADTAFDAVVAACAAPRADTSETWITPEMAEAYGRLHRLGLAHSVEVWSDDTDRAALIGGIYGVGIGRCFFGESMFSRATGGSKIALVHLLGQMRHWDMPLLDCQLHNAHLATLGARPMRRAAFLAELRVLLERPAPPSPWSLDYVW